MLSVYLSNRLVQYDIALVVHTHQSTLKQSVIFSTHSQPTTYKLFTQNLLGLAMTHV